MAADKRSDAMGNIEFFQQQAVVAQEVIKEHIAALNARDEVALAATLHFPHYRLSKTGLSTWEVPERYFQDFLHRAGSDWHHTELVSVKVIAASTEKVHLDVCFRRFRADNSVLKDFRSLWIIARIDNIWAAQFRSSFAE